MNNSNYGVLFVSEELVGQSEETCVAVVSDLTGKKFNSISSHAHGIIAACTDGFHMVSNSGVTSVPGIDFLQGSGGHNFFVAIDSKQKFLYSWGLGESGQLGHGACRTAVNEPTTIKYNSEFVSISCGDSFTVAVDKNCNAYGWGENFDRQLGLYTKEKAAMSLKNSVVEDLVFAPRLLPFSLKAPVVKVCCGPAFAVALSKSGDLYSWGAGECGQLGTGRCTRREIPAKVPVVLTSSEETVRLVDVACGAGHCIAVSSSGCLYAWGMNKSGQLGLGDTATRHAPTPVVDTSLDKSAALVFAEGQSSAVITTNGHLYTWGSNAHGRLMRCPNQEVAPNPVVVDPLDALDSADKPVKVRISFDTAPQKVVDEQFQGCRINSFAFSKYSSAALIHTTITRAFPTSGPKRSFSQLLVFGFGLWDSGTIVLRFTSKVYSAYNPPRSCAGHLVSTEPESGHGFTSSSAATTAICCKPPKFAEAGEYLVTVSMDGVNFLPQAIEITVYQEVTVLGQSPAIIDMRAQSSQGEEQLRLVAKGIVSAGSDSSTLVEYFVKLAFYDVSASPAAAEDRPVKRNSANEKSMAARLKGSATPSFEVITKGRADSTQPLTASAPQAEDANSAAGESLVVLLIDAVDLSFLKDSASSLFEMRCQVSLNGQDFGSQSGAGNVALFESFGSSTLFHAFTPQAMQPVCYVSDNLVQAIGQQQSDGAASALSHQFDREITVHGAGMLPTARMPRGSVVTVHVSTSATGNPDDEDSSLVLPVHHCESASLLRFVLNAAVLSQLCPQLVGDQLVVYFSFYLHRKQSAAISSGVSNSSSNNSISSGGEEEHITLLSDKRIPFYLCKATPLRLEPNYSKKVDGSAEGQRVTAYRSNGSRFPFASPDATVRVHFTGAHTSVPPVVLSGLAVTMAEFEDESGQGSGEYALQFDMPPLSEAAAGGALDRTAISLSLDGGDAVPEAVWCPYYFYSTLAKYTISPSAPPKGGFPAGAAVTLNLAEYCPPPPPSKGADACVVRIRGATHDSFVDVNAVMSDSAAGVATIQFTVPDVGKLGPAVLNGKDKMFFVDVSNDAGAIFDQADTPLLQVK